MKVCRNRALHITHTFVSISILSGKFSIYINALREIDTETVSEQRLKIHTYKKQNKMLRFFLACQCLTHTHKNIKYLRHDLRRKKTSKNNNTMIGRKRAHRNIETNIVEYEKP